MKLIVLGLTTIGLAFAQSNMRGNASGNGDFPSVAVRAEPKVVWEMRPGFRDSGGIAAASGIVVTGNVNSGGGAFGFDASTGRRLWGIPGHMKGDPAVDANSAYVVNRVGGISTRLSRVDLKSGKVMWTVTKDELGLQDAPPLVDGGRVYLNSPHGKVESFDAATGKSQWEFAYSREKGYCPTAMALAGGVLDFGGGEEVYSTSQGRFLWALDAATGKMLWRFQAMPQPQDRGGVCVSAPAVSNGVVVVTAERVVFAVDARSGQPRWRKDGVIRVNGEETSDFLSEPIISGGIVYSFMKRGLVGWNLSTGAQVFELQGDFGNNASANRMAAGGGVLYFFANLKDGSDADQFELPLCAYDPDRRALLWRHRVNRPGRFNSVARWRTRKLLPADGALYYENHAILVKLQ